MFHHHCMQAYDHIHMDFYFSRSTFVRTEGPMKKVMVGPLIRWVSMRVLMLRDLFGCGDNEIGEFSFLMFGWFFVLEKVETTCTVCFTSNISFSLAPSQLSTKHKNGWGFSIYKYLIDFATWLIIPASTFFRIQMPDNQRIEGHTHVLCNVSWWWMCVSFDEGPSSQLLKACRHLRCVGFISG